MECGDYEDEPPSYRDPLPLDDRLWRHPSEWSGAVAEIPALRLGPPRRVWPVAVASALGAGVASAAVVISMSGALVSTSGRIPTTTVASPIPVVSTAQSVSLVAPAAPQTNRTQRAQASVIELRTGTGRSGSAVVFHRDGYLLTSAQVLDPADAITAMTPDGTLRPARLIGHDSDTDVALVKVDGLELFEADLGSSAGLKVGDQVAAVGAARGGAGGPSVTVGVVRTLHRELVASGGGSTLFDMIQTDVALDPGSAGGALVDVGGSVVAITSGAAGGTGRPTFATPIDVARRVAEQMMNRGRAQKVWFGVEGLDVDDEAAADLDVEGGAVVWSVQPDSPAESSGIRPGDVILALDEHAVSSMSDLVVALRSKRPGDVVAVSFLRDGRPATESATLGENAGTFGENAGSRR